MSLLYEAVNKMYEESVRKRIRAFLNDRNVTQKIPLFIYKISSLILIFNLLQQYWNILEYIKIEPFPLLDAEVGNFVSNIISIAGFYWVGYHFVVRHILCFFVGYIDISKKTKYSPFMRTADDIIELFASLVFFVFSLDELLHLAHNSSYELTNKSAYIFAALYLVVLFILWVYNKNYRNSNTEKTSYYDNNNVRIFVGDRIVYHKKQYIVENGEKTILGFSANSKGDPFILVPSNYNDSIIVSLEEAVRDIDGKLTIVKS